MATTITQIEEASANNLVGTIKLSFREAMADQSKIDPAVLAIEGMSGRKYRQFINNLIRLLPNPRYLEVGSWAGSTLCSVVNGNTVSATVIDNWSEFGGPKEKFISNVTALKSETSTVTVIESDFRVVDYTAIGKHNVYLFDGPHAMQDQYDGIALALPALEAQFALVVDDWNWQHVRAGTLTAIAKAGLDIEYALEIRSTLDNSHPEPARQHSDWHNGYFIAVLRQR